MLIKQGDNDKDVGMLQLYLCIYLLKIGESPITVDNNFGPATKKAVQLLQGNTGIEPDGIVGPKTYPVITDEAHQHPRFQVRTFGKFHPVVGEIPRSSGTTSTFGGPDDEYDRMNPQAYIYNYPDVEKPSSLFKSFPLLAVMGIFRSECSKLDKYPNRRKASWCLDPNSFYCAMRFSGLKKSKLVGDLSPVIFVENPETGKGVLCKVTDYGPATYTGVGIDLSPGAFKAIGMKYKSGKTARVNISWAESIDHIGPVEAIKE